MCARKFVNLLNNLNKLLPCKLPLLHFISNLISTAGTPCLYSLCFSSLLLPAFSHRLHLFGGPELRMMGSGSWVWVWVCAWFWPNENSDARAMGPHLSFGTNIAPGSHEEQGPVLSIGTKVAPGSREGTWEPWSLFRLLEKFTLLEAVGPHFSFGTRIAPGGRKGTRGPHLSFGTRIAPGDLEGRGACFVLWNNDCFWRQ
jgi:hypothetical protein